MKVWPNPFPFQLRSFLTAAAAAAAAAAASVPSQSAEQDEATIAALNVTKNEENTTENDDQVRRNEQRRKRYREAKNEEDKDYVVKLYRQTIIHREEYMEYIKQNTRNWDLERIAFMDILIMQMALTELVVFPSIPTKVTLNEYLEISKYYSTSKSNVFINGVLDQVAIVKRGIEIKADHAM